MSRADIRIGVFEEARIIRHSLARVHNHLD
jgi:hypothetical protein